MPVNRSYRGWICLVQIWWLAEIMNILPWLTSRQTDRHTHTSTHTDLLMHPHRILKTRSVWPTSRVKIARRNKLGVNRHFQVSWASQAMGCLFIYWSLWSCLLWFYATILEICPFEGQHLTLSLGVYMNRDTWMQPALVPGLSAHKDLVILASIIETVPA